ncbi:PaaI family thioesterase [Microbacterium sp. H1-D42]|uniref:PaaI family thioesterase n=1 Tax=Microbacterium sp. H1-D42 TaxID=2925844 RepID=UPI001F52E4B4|nr:PaaI family thioesterase [Microbacterium sp. H1-D42]UNK71500.1 PaaI family thioesterase [Microbacterium sp. H1-D42]
MTDDRAPRPTPTDATPEQLTELGAGRLPGMLGITVTAIGEGRIEAEMAVTPAVLAPNGYLHAASVVALADTACGLGCRLSLPEGTSGFTTLEQKTSYLGTARSGHVRTVATLAHGGRRTQVWDAEVFDEDGLRIALFRCTQLML